MSLLRASVVIAILSSPVSAVAQTTTVAPQPLTIDGATTHLYKTVGTIALRLHVFNPHPSAGSVRKAAIIFFFGGGWRQGSVMQFVPQAQHVADRGMVAIVADYRVAGRHGTSPIEAMADAKSAVRWVRAHATELAIDPDRIAAAGGSAGGHIALSSAAIDSFDERDENRTVSSKPNALVLFNPVADTTGIAEFGNRDREASPRLHVHPGLPPTLILHGKADTTVPYATVERYCAEATRAENQCELVGYDGATHGFFNAQREDGKWFRETLLEADRFLTRLGYLPAPARNGVR